MKDAQNFIGRVIEKKSECFWKLKLFLNCFLLFAEVELSLKRKRFKKKEELSRMENILKIPLITKAFNLNHVRRRMRILKREF